MLSNNVLPLLRDDELDVNLYVDELYELRSLFGSWHCV